MVFAHGKAFPLERMCKTKPRKIKENFGVSQGGKAINRNAFNLLPLSHDMPQQRVFGGELKGEVEGSDFYCKCSMTCFCERYWIERWRRRRVETRLNFAPLATIFVLKIGQKRIVHKKKFRDRQPPLEASGNIFSSDSFIFNLSVWWPKIRRESALPAGIWISKPIYDAREIN